MILERGSKSLNDLDRNIFARLIDFYFLKSSLKGAVLLDVFLVFTQSGRSNNRDFPTTHRRLENIRSIESPLSGPCANDRMNLIDEKNNLILHTRCLIDNLFNTCLELASILRPSNERRKTQIHYPFIEHRHRNLSLRNALCQTFNDCRFSDSGLTDETRVIFRFTIDNRDQTIDFFITTDNTIKTTFTGLFRQV
jgi:hypothetical protein